jgi:hypothetical protein
MRATAFCSTTNPRAAARRSLRAKFREPLRASIAIYNTPSTSAISTPSATGVGCSAFAMRLRLVFNEFLFFLSLKYAGHARDYVYGMWLILQQEKPDDFVLATGETHTVREFIEKAFAVVGTTVKWIGADVDEKGVDAADESRVLVSIDPAYFRPTEVDLLLGDPAKAKAKLGWEAKVLFEELVKEMVLADLALVDRGEFDL